MDGHFQAEFRAQDPRAEESLAVGLPDGLFQPPGLGLILAPDVHERGMDVACVRGQERSLDDRVRIMANDEPVFERARLPFIGIDAEVFRLIRLLRDEAPFHPGREARPSPAPQSGFLDLVQDLGGSHAPQGLDRGGVASAGAVAGDGREVRQPIVLGQHVIRRPGSSAGPAGSGACPGPCSRIVPR